MGQCCARILISDQKRSPSFRLGRPPLFKPLHLAVLGGVASLVESLLTRGADVNALSGHGLTPLEQLYDFPSEQNSSHHNCAKLLLDYGGKFFKHSLESNPDSFNKFRNDFPDQVPYEVPDEDPHEAPDKDLYLKPGLMSRLKRRLKRENK